LRRPYRENGVGFGERPKPTRPAGQSESGSDSETESELNFSTIDKIRLSALDGEEKTGLSLVKGVAGTLALNSPFG
jgi:hypothetical protein